MHEMNKCALHYGSKWRGSSDSQFVIWGFALFLGLGRQDFMSLLTKDLDEQESARIAKEEEQERAMYSV